MAIPVLFAAIVPLFVMPPAKVETETDPCVRDGYVLVTPTKIPLPAAVSQVPRW